jgi:hypothetical protein
MKCASTATKSPRQTGPQAHHGESAGRNGVSLAPPEYGIDFVDRSLADLATAQGNAGLYQAKLTVGLPGDEYEREADRVAEQVMRIPEPQLQRQPLPQNEDEVTELLQAKPVEGQLLQRT